MLQWVAKCIWATDNIPRWTTQVKHMCGKYWVDICFEASDDNICLFFFLELHVNSTCV